MIDYEKIYESICNECRKNNNSINIYEWHLSKTITNLLGITKVEDIQTILDNMVALKIIKVNGHHYTLCTKNG